MPPQVTLDVLNLGLKIKKTPVVVGNCTGFAVNRIFFPYTMAACMLVDLGMDPYTIDAVIKGMFGMPMGPFRLSDLVRFPRLSVAAHSRPPTCLKAAGRNLGRLQTLSRGALTGGCCPRHHSAFAPEMCSPPRAEPLVSTSKLCDSASSPLD